MRIVFAGTPKFAVPALRALCAAGHQIEGVLTQPDRPAGRGRQLQASPVKQFAESRSLPLSQPARLNTEAERAALWQWRPEVMVVVAYGLILPPAVLALPAWGCLNIHASLLPRWRGAAPIQRAILAGDPISGVSIMQMEAGLDTGPILQQQSVPIDERMNAAELHDVLAELGPALLLQTLAALPAGTRRAVPQAAEGVTYAAKLDKAEARIDWRADAVQIARQVRAFNPWPIADTRLGGEQLRIWSAVALPDAPGAAPGTVLGLIAGRLLVACGRGTLAISVLQPAGRRQLAARDFANAHPLAALRFE